MNKSILTDSEVYSLLKKFEIGAGIASVKPFGTGHINDTYRIINGNVNGVDYLLQRVNHHVFTDVPSLMQNLLNVTSHLKQKLSSIPGADTEKQVLTIVQTKDERPYFEDQEGNYWRVYYFLKDTRSYDLVETEKQAFEGGKAFGRFQALLSDLDTSLIKDTIPDFHHIGSRLNKLRDAINADPIGRLTTVLPEVGFIEQRADAMGEILRLGEAGILPKRIVHNDTKFNNVLLDADDKAQCVIDLDTVMPGYAAYDFGDSIRTIINTAAEDEEDVSKIGLNIPLFKAYTDGYLQEAMGFLSGAEIESLMKAVLLMPYIQVVRFLTDYLEGDHYFKIHSPLHNLQRARAQAALIIQLENNQEELNRVINQTWQHYKK